MTRYSPAPRTNSETVATQIRRQAQTRSARVAVDMARNATYYAARDRGCGHKAAAKLADARALAVATEQLAALRAQGVRVTLASLLAC